MALLSPGDRPWPQQFPDASQPQIKAPAGADAKSIPMEIWRVGRGLVKTKFKLEENKLKESH